MKKFVRRGEKFAVVMSRMIVYTKKRAHRFVLIGICMFV